MSHTELVPALAVKTNATERNLDQAIRLLQEAYSMLHQAHDEGKAAEIYNARDLIDIFKLGIQVKAVKGQVEAFKIGHHSE